MHDHAQQKAGARTITSAARQHAPNAATRAEAMALIHRNGWQGGRAARSTTVTEAAAAASLALGPSSPWRGRSADPGAWGDRQRHAGLLRRRALVQRPTRRRPRPRPARRRCRHSLDIGGESTRLVRPAPSSRRSWVASYPSSPPCRRARPSRSTRDARGGRGAVAAGPPSSTTSWGPGRPAHPRRRGGDRVRYVAMHWRAHADHMRDFAVYDGPGGGRRRSGTSSPRGWRRSSPRASSPTGWSLDPAWVREAGRPQLGAAAHLGPLMSLGYPALVGSSRKSFLGGCSPTTGARPRPVDQRGTPTPPSPWCSPSEVCGAAGATSAPPATRSASRSASTHPRSTRRPIPMLTWRREPRMTDELAVTGIECMGTTASSTSSGARGRSRDRPGPGHRHRAAAASDDLRDTDDYGSLVARVKTAVRRDPVDLIRDPRPADRGRLSLGRSC